MTQDEIIEMARQAGALQISFNQTSMQYEYSMFSKQIVDFARLIADKEREACAKYVEGLMVGNQPLTVVMGAIGDGIRARGEA
jgi:hypothetical protein